MSRKRVSDPAHHRSTAKHQQRTWGERFGDVAAGGTIFAWGVVGLSHRHASILGSPVLLSIISLNLVVAVLFCRRGPARHVANLGGNLLAIPSIVLGPFALHRSPGFDDWPWILSLVFLLGSGLAVCALVNLGKSFAIFPAARNAVHSGPYRYLRHPAYLGELVMAITATATRPDRVSLLLAVMIILTTMRRIIVEESVMESEGDYRQYTGQVRWRLVPGVW